MNELANNAYSAGILLRLALNPKATPYQDKEYANLLHELNTNPSFRIIFENLAEGLELEILDYGNHGVVLAGKEKSPFAYRMVDYRGKLSVEDRVCHGLVQLAIACYCYPTVEALDQDDEVLRPRFSTDQVVEDEPDNVPYRTCQAARRRGRGLSLYQRGSADTGCGPSK